MPAAPPAEPPRDSRDWFDLTRVNSRRALALMALGALTGLFLAGLALFTAKGTSTLIVPPEDVALVNQQPIARSDYMGQLRTLYDVDPAHATAYIMNPLSGRKSSFPRWFTTHPPTAERIARLRGQH